MRIQMIGNSQAGKTTFMAAMYHVMAEEGGYQIRLSDYGQRQNLERLGNDLARGIYPPQTAVQSEYNFDFLYDDVEFFKFKWMDYRGGALMERASESEVSADVYKCSNESDSMIVFIDGSTMNDRASLRYWKRLLIFMNNFVANTNQNNPRALVIMVTKMDLVKEDDILGTLVGQEIGKFIRNIDNNYLHGMVCFTATNKNTYGNVVYPFLWSMRIPLMKEAHQKLDELNDAIEEWNNRSWLEKLLSEIFGSELMARIKHLQALVEYMHAHFEHISKTISDDPESCACILF